MGFGFTASNPGNNVIDFKRSDREGFSSLTIGAMISELGTDLTP
jgi:hypothetical protein